MTDRDDASDGFTFEGSWREYLPTVATNLLLTLVTLGFYRFWAKTRERQYLWSRTRMLGEPLEWAGTGKEMFIGFLVALAVFLPLVLFLNFGVQALILRGQGVAAGIGALVAWILLLWFVGLAQFRAVRYRLSRTYWRGIRGGSDDNGTAYGRSYLLRSAAGLFTLGALVPWVMTTLWRKRWGAMSFGPYPVAVGEGAATRGLKRRWLLLYLTPFAMLAMVKLAAFTGFSLMFATGSDGGEIGKPGALLFAVVIVAAVYIVIPLLFLPYWSAFYRKAVGEMSLGNLRFDFSARTTDWLKLVLGHILLFVGTLGLGYGFIAYRNWAFFARHLSVEGEMNPAELTQSSTSLRSDAEGLADAFDVGAI